MDLRSPLILGALPAGLATGAAIWLLVGGPSLASAPLAPLEDRIAQAFPGPPPAPQRLVVNLVNDALSTPLFSLTTGPGAVTEVTLRLDGLARTPSHSAALISIGGKPAEWLKLGETRDDVTLEEVQASRVVVDTATGFKTVGLGEGPPDPANTSPASQAAGSPPPPARPPVPAQNPGAHG